MKFSPILIIASLSVLRSSAAADDLNDFPYALNFEVGATEFAPGDSITITQLHGTLDTVVTNGVYCVEGSYTLASADEASLSFYATTTDPTPSPNDPRQSISIKKGSGTFRLIKPMSAAGYLHVSFYYGGTSRGGVYFGQGQWVLRHKSWSDFSKAASDAPASPNQAIMNYLGDPVPAPGKLAAAYTRDGLTGALQLAAQQAGISWSRRSPSTIPNSPSSSASCVTTRTTPKITAQLKSRFEYDDQGGKGGGGDATWKTLSRRAPFRSLRASASSTASAFASRSFTIG